MIGIDDARALLETKCGMIMAGACVRDGYTLVPVESKYRDMALEAARGLSNAGLPTSVEGLQALAVDAKRAGDLETANSYYKLILAVEYPYRKIYIWGWIKVMLLAKNWDDAHFLLYYLYEFNAAVNRSRIAAGDSMADYRMWGLTPHTEIVPRDLAGYLREVGDCPFSTKQETEEKIRACGGSEYWNTHYSLSQNDYNAFTKLFGDGASSRVAYDAAEEARRKQGVLTAELKSTPRQGSTSSSSSSSGGCYIATAVYGSYDCPEVWTLRRFRDAFLARSMAGRAFIRTYYATSPTLVKWFGDAEWFKRPWKAFLDVVVKKLQRRGYSELPYED